jgi:hypothetical protein
VRKTLALASAVLVPLAIIITTSLPALAMGGNAGNDPCLIDGSQSCVDLPADSNTLQIDNGTDGIGFSLRGSVNSSWPFSSTTWNTHYHGHLVFELTRGSDLSDCMRTDATRESPARVYFATGQACSNHDSETLWVVSGNWLVNAYQSNYNTSNPSILQTQCIAKGCDVYSDYSNFAANDERQWTAINLGLGTS